MEEMHRMRCEERGAEFPSPPYEHPPKKLFEPPLGFYGAFVA